MSVKAQELMRFLRLFFHDGEQAHFFFRMIDSVYMEYSEKRKVYPNELHNINLKSKYPDAAGYHRPLKDLAKGMSATVGTSEHCMDFFEIKVQQLEDFHALGYEILFCPNPLKCKRKLKKTVKEIRFVVFESDKATLEEQRLLMEVLRPSLRAVVFSGGKSLHMYLPINPPIRNPKVISGKKEFKGLWSSNIERVDIDIPELNAVLEKCKRLLSILSFGYDAKVLSTNFARYFRLPLFKNLTTDNYVEIRQGNSNPSIGFLTIAEYLGVNNLEMNEEALKAWREFKGDKIDKNVTGIEQVMCLLDNPIPDTTVQPSDIQALKKDRKTDNDVKSRNFKGKVLFLRDMEEYDQIRVQGLPSRHTRLIYHLVMFTAARVFKWTDDQLFTEWERILRIKPNSTVLSVEAAVADLKKEWELKKGKKFEFWMPNEKSLPTAVSKYRSPLTKNLKRMNCPKLTPATDLILKALYPVVKKAMMPCLEGSAWINAEMMRKACKCNGRNYKILLRWLNDANIFKTTLSSYVVGERSKEYYVNVMLLLYLMGVKEGELNWESVPKGNWKAKARQKKPLDAERWLDDNASTSSADFVRFVDNM